MTFVPAIATCKTTLQWTWAGQSCATVLWFSNGGTEPTQANRQALNSALHTWYTGGKTNLCSGISLGAITSINQASASDPGDTLVIPGGEAGTGGASALPTNSCLVVSLRTALRGRSYRGRIYVPGLLGSSVVGETAYDTTAIGYLLSWFGQLLTPSNVANFIWIVASHFANKAPRVTAVKTPVSTVIADTYLDSQRRRLALRGT